MKFSIRDLLLVTVIVALAVSWWMNRRQLIGDNARHKVLEEQLRKEAQEAKAESEFAKKAHSQMLKTYLRQKREPIRGIPRSESRFIPARIPQPEEIK